MRPLWTFVLAFGLAITACGKQEQSGQSSTAADGKAKTGEMKGMEGMAGMEGMETGAGDSAGATGAGVKLDRTAADRLGISFARAAVRPLGRETRVVGTLTYAEPRRQYVNARVMGWVERLYADYMGKPVQKGDALLALYSPSWSAHRRSISRHVAWATSRSPQRPSAGSCCGISRRTRSIAWNVPERPAVPSCSARP